MSDNAPPNRKSGCPDDTGVEKLPVCQSVLCILVGVMVLLCVSTFLVGVIEARDRGAVPPFTETALWRVITYLPKTAYHLGGGTVIWQ